MADLPTLALTLIQPWGSLIIHHGKDVENRSWMPSGRLRPGDRLWVHAGKKWDEAGDMAGRCFSAAYVSEFGSVASPAYERGVRPPLPRGALLGHVRFDGVAHASWSHWFVGPFGWQLSDPIALPEPVPCRGAQGLWRVPDGALEQAREVLRG